MAYNAELVAVAKTSSGTYTKIPQKYIFFDSYKITPDQILDLDSGRDTTGVLHRNALSHTATKIEFETPPITNSDWNAVWSIIKANIANTKERYLYVRYYNMLTDSYKTGKFYLPDVEFQIERVDDTAKIIYYERIRLAFVEY